MGQTSSSCSKNALYSTNQRYNSRISTRPMYGSSHTNTANAFFVPKQRCSMSVEPDELQPGKITSLPPKKSNKKTRMIVKNLNNSMATKSRLANQTRKYTQKRQQTDNNQAIQATSFCGSVNSPSCQLGASFLSFEQSDTRTVLFLNTPCDQVDFEIDIPVNSGLADVTYDDYLVGCVFEFDPVKDQLFDASITSFSGPMQLISGIGVCQYDKCGLDANFVDTLADNTYVMLTSPTGGDTSGYINADHEMFNDYSISIHDSNYIQNSASENVYVLIGSLATAHGSGLANKMNLTQA